MSSRPTSRWEARWSQNNAAVDGDEGPLRPTNDAVDADDADEERRRREDNMLEFLKNKRAESWLKPEELQPQQIQPAVNVPQLNLLEKLPLMVARVRSNVAVRQLEATTKIRTLLSIENPPIKEVIESGVVSRFIEFLERDNYPQLQFEATRVLTNIASGASRYTEVVIDHGAIPLFVRLLGSPSDVVREEAVWALGNIAGDSPKSRDLVLTRGALMHLLAQFNDRAKLSMLRNATWTLAKFCSGKPQLQFEQVKQALAAVARVIHTKDESVLANACWALAYISDCTNDEIKPFIEGGVCHRLVELLFHTWPSILIPALRAVGNIVTGYDLQTEVIIDNRTLKRLLNLLTEDYNKSINKEACCTISKITARSKEKIQAVIEAGIISALVLLLQNAEFEIKKEAVCAISNATSGGTHDQIKFLVHEGCIEQLCDLVVCPDPSIIIFCLKGLENILKVGETEKNQGYTGDVNVFKKKINDAKGMENMASLQNHDNEEIRKKAIEILDTYWLRVNRS